MKFTILPKKTLSKWSFWLLISSAILLILFFTILKVFEPKGGDTFFSTPSLAIPLLLSFITSVMAFITGTSSIIFSKARSLSVFLTSIIGLLATIFGTLMALYPD